MAKFAEAGTSIGGRAGKRGRVADGELHALRGVREDTRRGLTSNKW